MICSTDVCCQDRAHEIKYNCSNKKYRKERYTSDIVTLQLKFEFFINSEIVNP